MDCNYSMEKAAWRSAKQRRGPIGGWDRSRLIAPAGRNCGSPGRPLLAQHIQILDFWAFGRKCVTSFSGRCGAHFLKMAERGRFRNYRLFAFARSQVNSNLDQVLPRSAVRARRFSNRIYCPGAPGSPRRTAGVSMFSTEPAIHIGLVTVSLRQIRLPE